MEQGVTKLKQFRKKLGLSVDYIASQLEVSRSTVYRWEAGTTPIPMLAAADLADILGVSLDALFGRKAAAEIERYVNSWLDEKMFKLTPKGCLTACALSFGISSEAASQLWNEFECTLSNHGYEIIERGGNREATTTRE